MDYYTSALLSRIQPPKRKVFVSYHHADQSWVDNFRHTFGTAYDILYDNSLDHVIDSYDNEYLRRNIRENHITNTSITIVACGPETWKRKWVDWEIYMTLNKGHALLGVSLPTNTPSWNGYQQIYSVPARLHTNVQNGYAHHITWTADAQTLQQAIEHAIQRSKAYKSDNSAATMDQDV